MSNLGLLRKAREILARPQQSPLSGPIPTDVQAEGFVIERAAPHARPIFWETSDGRIVGPAVPEFLGRDKKAFWVSTTFEGNIWWINADLLRSRQQWAEQKPIIEVDRHLLKA
jgi:hypothetical protein